MPRDRHCDGFSLIETLISMAIVATLAAAVAALTVATARALRRSRLEATVVSAAQARVEQLRALAWSYGSAHQPIASTDTATSVGLLQPTPGGPGLGASPADALEVDRLDHVDYLDQQGRWLGSGPPGPIGARFIRRWRVQPVPTYPDLLLIQVRVIDSRAELRVFDVATLRVRTAG